MIKNKADNNVKISLWMVGWSILSTTFFATIVNPFMFLDVALLSVAFYGLWKRIYWIAIVLCAYWVINAFLFAATATVLTWIIRAWFTYQFIVTARQIGEDNIKTAIEETLGQS